MGQQSRIQASTRSEAIAVGTGILVGIGVGMAVLYATGTVILAMGIAPAVSHLVHRFLVNRLRSAGN